MSAEVGAPHEVTPTELVMLARMGATVMGKVWTRAASKRGRSKKLEQSARKGSVAEVLTGVHSHLFFTGRFGQKVRKEGFPICSLLFVEEQRGNADMCAMLM